MKQSHLLRLFLCLLCNLSLQSQLFRDLSGLTVQNLQAQASQWTLSDPSGTNYSPTISDCVRNNIVVKPYSLPTGTTFKKTFDNLEDHNVLRFFVRIYYMGEYSSQTVGIKFDEVLFETSQVLPDIDDPEYYPCSPLPYAGRISYSGMVEHNSSSVTVEFSSNLDGTNVEITWGLRDFSFAPDFSDISEPSIIYADGYDTDVTILPDNCFEGRYGTSEWSCSYCTEPCSVCYGSGSDKCFVFRAKSPEARLCPEGQTLLSSGCANCPENCTVCDQDVNKCDTCLTTCALCNNGQCKECTLESNLVLYEGSCLPSCPEGYYENFERKCQACPSSGCPECSGNLVAQDGICKCKAPRILIGANCECPAYMVENSDTSNCDYIDLIDIAYQSTVSPLFDAVLQVQINPLKKWTDPVSITWVADCTFKNLDTRDLFQTYMATQNTDVLLIPSSFLEYSFQCAVSASFPNGNNIEISKTITFTTLSSSQPQVHILGGSFQILDHTELNFIFAKVKSSTGKVLSTSNLQQIQWTQTSGDKLDMGSIFSSSNPFQLKLQKCTLSQGKIYKFKLSVTLKSNGQKTSQEVTLGVYAPKVQTQITGLAENYHLFSKPLTLKAQLLIQDDECNQKNSLKDTIDQSTAMYTWECFYLDLATNRRLLARTPQITDDPNILIHPDPLKLFYQSTSSPTLTIPSSYFTPYPEYQFIFYLTVTTQSKSSPPSITKFNLQQPSLYTPKNQTHLRMVTSEPFTTASFACVSENNCQAYSANFPTKFVGSTFNSRYSYNWQVNTFGHYQDKNFFSTFLTISSISIPMTYNKFVPQILYTISHGTNTASAFLALPWNYAPENGFINVYPRKGDAYTTKFFISTYGWTDIDLPVSFQFFTTYNSYESPKNLLLKTLNPFDETILLPEASDSSCKIGVIVKDNLQSTANTQTVVELTGMAQNLCEAVEKSRQALTSSKQSHNLYQRFRLIQMIMENLKSWEWYDDQSSCNVTDAQFKFTAITEMRDIFVALNKKTELRAPLLNSIGFGSDQSFVQDNYWELSMDILDSYFQADSSTSILPPGEYNPLFLIIDNLIYSMKKPESSIEDPEKVFIYINTLLRSTLFNVIPTDAEVSYQGTFYTYFTLKTTYCHVLEGLTPLPYMYFGLEANVTLRANKQVPPAKCNDQIDMIYMVFRPNYTLSDDSEDYEQSVFYFDLRDSMTGKSLLDIFTFTLNSPVDLCPEDNGEEEDGGEVEEGEGWICDDCDDEGDVRILEDVDEDDGESEEEEECSTGGDGSQIYGIFDLKNQINKIFVKSNIDQIQNISVLEDFQFWKSVAFWTVITFSLWFLLSFYWLYIKHPTYCALKASKNITQKSLFQKISLFFWVTHPIVGIYLYNDPKATKPTKLAIYYQRLVIVMVFSTIFSSIEKGEGQVFKTYILLFNTVTVTPINALLSRIFDNVFSTKNSKKKTLTNLRLFTGILFYLAFLAGCFVIMFIIEAQQEASQNKDWALNFLISFIQDLSLSPLISIISKVSLTKLSQSDRFSKILNHHPKLLDLLLPLTFRFIYQAIFVKLAMKTIVDDCQSPRITTTSPLSSDRKLLKFSTLEFKSPASSKIQTPYEFRSRRASETEMNTVDIVTTEALVSNRFQTFFSEAKPENVKQFSPIMKENYPKMQSSNLYSSTYTNTKLLRSLVGGDPKSLLMKSEGLRTKPMASIVFHPETEPVETNPEEIFSFGENSETMYASQPKPWKNGKTMESSVHKKTKKDKKDRSNRCETVI